MEQPRRRRSLTLRSHCPIGDARLNKVLGCFGPRVETDLPEHFAVLLGVHVVVPKGAISIKKGGCDGLDRCGQFVEQGSRLQVSTVLRVFGSLERRQSAVCSKSSLSASLISSSVILCPPAKVTLGASASTGAFVGHSTRGLFRSSRAIFKISSERLPSVLMPGEFIIAIGTVGTLFEPNTATSAVSGLGSAEICLSAVGTIDAAKPTEPAWFLLLTCQGPALQPNVR